ncbi:major capsid hexamer protein [Microbacterium phage Phinky]|nr:major capsid hexamer protein [Microbacterium phage Phinky]
MFVMPETLDGLSLEEVSKLRREAVTAAQALNEIPAADLTAEQATELVELVGHVGTLSERHTALSEEAAAGDAVAQARAVLEGIDLDAEEAAAAEAAAEGGDGGEGADAEGADAEENTEVDEKDLVVASAAAKSKGAAFGAKVGANVAKTAAAGGSSDERDVNRILEQAKGKELSLVAAANVPGFASEQKLKGFDELANAYGGRTRQFESRLASGNASRMRGGKSLEGVSFNGGVVSDKAERFGVARLEKPANEFTITERMSTQDAYDLIMRAASEKRLAGKSLTAAGGWCSPSEIVYGFLELETAEGLLNIAEIQASRGGIQFTKGPQLGDLLINAELGWVMTEAQAEAGTFTKPVFDIDCPDWDEVRMDAVGYALRAGLLTNTTFPEVLRRYLALALIVHARRMNKLTIDRISDLIGTATVFANVGATPSLTADLLDSIELNALRIREQYSMGLNATVEAIFPIWVKMLVRSDLSRRLGVENMLSVTDQQIDQWFKARQIAPQFVRDYQPINNGATSVAGGTAAWTTMPNKVEYMLYPAGAFVRLATPVIDLDAVYDTDNLTKNQFLAAFFEEGFAIANTGASGVKVQVNLPNRYGSTGFPGIGAGEGVTFAAA